MVGWERYDGRHFIILSHLSSPFPLSFPSPIISRILFDEKCVTMMSSAVAARKAATRLPFSKQWLSIRHSSARAASASLTTVEGDDSHMHNGWAASLLAIAAATTVITVIGTTTATPTLAEAREDIEEEEESTRILNWSGTHHVDLAPGTYHEPETQLELEALVADAYRKGQHIRPVGSALSPNGLAFDSRGMVCLSNLDKIVEINKDEMTVTVQAGARVSQVLDALRPHGLTLPNLASIAEQQIGGFVSVGAHGTGALIPPCDEFVTALTIVTPSENGVVKMTEATHGQLFRLARLGLGGLGILSEVTLKVIPAHRLVEQTSVLSRSEAKKQLPTLLKRHKHIRYMWVPYEDCA